MLLTAVTVVCAVVLGTHWTTLDSTALCSDDLEYWIQNKTVQNPSMASAKKFLTEVLRPSTVGGYYQPLSMISLMLDVAAGASEENPRPFHVTSLTLHVLNTGLVVVLIYLLFGNVLVAAIVGLIFGVHPMTVEPIAWVSERKTVLASFFALWCLVLYVRYTQTGGKVWFGGSIIALLLALMTKPIATGLPVCMLLMDIWPLRRFNAKALLEKIPLLVIVGVSAWITFVSQRNTFGVNMPSERPPLYEVLVVCHNIVFYLRQIVWPVSLTPHYPPPNPMDLSQPMVLIGVIGTIVLIGGLLALRKRTAAPLVSWLWFFVMIFPSIGVIGFTVVVASDKFAYLPSVGLLILLAAGLGWLWARAQSNTVRIGICAIAILLAGGEAIATRIQISKWRDTETLCNHMIHIEPESAWVRNATAVNYFRKGRFDDGYEQLQIGLRLDPEYSELHNSMGWLMIRRGDIDKAIEHYRTAVRIRPSYHQARSNLARTLKQKQAAEAIKGAGK